MQHVVRLSRPCAYQAAGNSILLILSATVLVAAGFVAVLFKRWGLRCLWKWPRVSSSQLAYQLAKEASLIG